MERRPSSSSPFLPPRSGGGRSLGAAVVGGAPPLPSLSPGSDWRREGSCGHSKKRQCSVGQLATVAARLDGGFFFCSRSIFSQVSGCTAYKVEFTDCENHFRRPSLVGGVDGRLEKSILPTCKNGYSSSVPLGWYSVSYLHKDFSPYLVNSKTKY